MRTSGILQSGAAVAVTLVATAAAGQSTPSSTRAQPTAAQSGSSAADPASIAPENATTAQNEPSTTRNDPLATQNEGDIVVTAQRRAERLQDVPVAVTAVSGKTLTNLQINSTTALSAISPSLTFTPSASTAQANFRIRGVGSATNNVGLEPTVSVVVDGIVLARSAQGFTDLADIERVEVLRGPQGTLFGKNASAGVISVSTQRPSRDLTMQFDGTIAEQNEYRAKGFVAGPLSDAIRISVAGYYNNVGGYIRNVVNGEMLNGSKSWGVRGKADVDLASNLNLLFTASYGKGNANCCQPVIVGTDSPLLSRLLTADGITPNRENRKVEINAPVFDRTRQGLYSLEANLDLGGATLTSITAYQTFRERANNDIDNFNTPQVRYFQVTTQGQQDVADGRIDLKQFSQEVRVSGKVGHLRYVGGGYYQHLTLDRFFGRRIGSCPAGGANVNLTLGQNCPAPTFGSVSVSSGTGNENYAAFGQIDLKIFQGLAAFAGARYQHEKISYFGNRAGPLPQYLADSVLTPPTSGTGASSQNAFTPKAGLKYEFSTTKQVYASYARGYKGRAYNIELSVPTYVNQQPIGAEHVDAYEVGAKLQLFDRKVTLNAAAFYSNYKGLQAQSARPDIADPTRLVPQPTNVKGAKAKGAEIELTYRVTPRFTINGGVTYLDTKVDAAALSCPIALQTSSTPVAAGQAPPVNRCYTLPASASTFFIDVKDGPLPNAPHWRGSLTVRYEAPINDRLAGFVQLFGQAQTSSNFSLERAPTSYNRGYATVDGTIGVLADDSKYQLSLFVKNMFDERYYGSVGNGTFFSTSAVPYTYLAQVTKASSRYFGGSISIRY